MKKFLEKISEYKFVLMIVIVTVVAAIFCCISVYIYVSTGAINIDLSRPGYEKNREDTSYEEENTSFSSSGPINGSVIEDFNQRLNKLQDELNGMNNFSPDALTDETLGM